MKVALLRCKATNLTHFLQCIASVLKTEPVNLIFFIILFSLHKEAKTGKIRKTSAEYILLKFENKNGNFKIGKILLHSFLPHFLHMHYAFVLTILCIKK